MHIQGQMKLGGPLCRECYVIPGLNVRDLLAVADGLDVVGGVGGVGAEQGGHPLAQAVTHCKVNNNCKLLSSLVSI